MRLEHETSFNSEQVSRFVGIGKESLVKMGRIGKRINNYNGPFLLSSNYEILHFVTTIYSQKKEIISKGVDQVVAESISSPFLRSAETGIPDEEVLTAIERRKMTDPAETFGLNYKMASAIDEIIYISGVNSDEVLTDSGFTIFDWMASRLKRNEIIGSLDRDKGTIGVVTFPFMKYEMSIDECASVLSRLYDVVTVNLPM